VQADQIQPELTVSEVLAYHHGQNELAIEAEIELDVREAPLRELILHVPKGYAIARLNASGMSDYFLREPATKLMPNSVSSMASPSRAARSFNSASNATSRSAKRTGYCRGSRSPRRRPCAGNVGVSADAGFRLTPERTQALTEIATAFFPRKVANIQSAFRLSEPGWQATMRVERLPQTVQVDGFHLFSIGEGIAYGSSVMNYSISGAPVAAFRVELSDEYFNVEFTWQGRAQLAEDHERLRRAIALAGRRAPTHCSRLTSAPSNLKARRWRSPARVRSTHRANKATRSSSARINFK
jgi:hypothetical protein